jgi:hypothetical protein
MKEGLKKDELGDELCNFCPLDENRKGTYSTPGGLSAGCEGSHCDIAYDNYVESLNEEPRKKLVYASDVWRDDDD